MSKREKLTDRRDLMKQWDYKKNVLDPLELTMGSGKRAWWKCSEGHSWETVIAARRNGAGCPHCSRKNMRRREKLSTRADLMVQWDYDKNELNPSKLTVGSTQKAWWKCKEWHSWKASIANRSYGAGCPYCSYNDRLILERVTEHVDLMAQWDFEKNKLDPSQLSVGSDKKAWWKCDKGHSWQAKISRQRHSAGCVYCNGRKVLSGFNDLQTRNPALAKEWAYEKNKLTPSQVMPGSDRKAWWKCSKGHLWQATISNRNNGWGCPYCSGYKVLAGFNDLQTRNPALAEEWAYEKNKLTPSEVALASSQKVWWKCGNGHYWKAMISSRSVNGNECPHCYGRFPYLPRCVSSVVSSVRK